MVLVEGSFRQEAARIADVARMFGHDMCIADAEIAWHEFSEDRMNAVWYTVKGMSDEQIWDDLKPYLDIP